MSGWWGAEGVRLEFRELEEKGDRYLVAAAGSYFAC